MATITGWMTVCECCAMWLANNDDSSCRDYYGHTHKRGEFPAGAVIDGEFETYWSRVNSRCEACGDGITYGSNVIDVAIH